MQPTGRRWAIFVLACSTSFFLYLHRYTWNFIGPQLKDEYDLVMAESGREALRMAGDGSLEAILLDVMMPGEDGLDVLERIKQKTTAPVIMVTALDNAKSAVRAMKTGAFDYITKPFGVDDIRLVVERALSAHQFMRENGGIAVNL